MQNPPLYKVLVNGESRHLPYAIAVTKKFYAWSLPVRNDDGTWTPGAWHEVAGDVVLCKNGLHLTPDPLAWWLDGAVVYRVEAEGLVGDPANCEDECGRPKVVAKRVRLLEPVDVTALLDARHATWLAEAAEARRKSEKARLLWEAEAPLREAQAAERARHEAAENAAWEQKKKCLAREGALARKAEREEEARRLAWSPAKRAAAQKRGELVVSPVVAAATVLWKNMPTRSWRRRNDGMAQFLRLAIETGMPFDESDVVDLYAQLHGAYWLFPEHLYVFAVEAQNVAACRAIERHLGRSPWIVLGQRLAVGSTLKWQGETCTVTSFNDAKDTLVACVRADAGDGRSTGTPEVSRRFTVTRKAFREVFAKKPRRGAP